MMRVKRAIFFDLDSCLCAADEAGEDLYAPAFAAIRTANRGVLDEDRLQAAFREIWHRAFDVVSAAHGFSDAMRRAGWEAFSRIEVASPLRGYGDLHVLAGLPARLFLVTSGFRRLQESKIRALGIAHRFAAVHIDAIDEPGRKGKERIFAEILASDGLRPREVLVVGDRADSEIAAGNRLGIATVQILRPGVPRTDTAGHHIASLTELPPLLVPARRPRSAGWAARKGKRRGGDEAGWRKPQPAAPASVSPRAAAGRGSPRPTAARRGRRRRSGR